MTKLTLNYFLRRLAKSKTPADVVRNSSNIGLFYQDRMFYFVNRYLDEVKEVVIAKAA